MNESEEAEQKKDSSFFLNFTSAISGAKETATNEFEKFCENIGWRPKPGPVIVRNKYDMARVQAGQSIHGRILPDRYRRSHGKDVEIQTDEIPEQDFEGHKRRSSVSSLNMDRVREHYRPAKLIKKEHTTPIQSPERENTAPTQLLKKSVSTQLFKESVLQQPVFSVGNSSPHTSNYPSEEPYKSLHSFPNREPKSSITTGSKSVKRLTSELEKIFSAQQLPSFKKPKTEPRSTPAIESVAGILERDKEKMESQIENIVSKTPPLPPPLPSLPELSTQKPRKVSTLEQFELEEERMQLLEKKLGDIHCQMSNFVTHNSNTSPIPSYTPRPMSMSPMPASPIRPAMSPITKRNSLSSFDSPSRINNIDYSSPSPVRETLKHFRESSSPIPKPNDKHISKMRVLIQQIPVVQLRKTDRIIGPDGEEKPNPIWHEIYGKKRSI